MKVTMTKVMLGAIALLVATTAQAQENFQLASHTMFAQLEQEVSNTNGELGEIKARLASLESGDMSVIQKGGDCCCDDWCSPCCGWIGSAELLLLRPHNAEGQTSSNQYQTGSRYMVGSMDECGRSWRVRYFEYYHDNFDNSSLTLETLDFEYGARFQLGCNWHGEITAGLRWAEYRDPNVAVLHDTIGPVLGVELRNNIYCDIDLVARYRQSLQFGEFSDRTGGGNEGHGTFSVTEIFLGAEATRCIAGYDMFVRTGLEAQSWEGPDDADNEDVGLIGFAFAVGIAR